jgi:hypothetical protein
MKMRLGNTHPVSAHPVRVISAISAVLSDILVAAFMNMECCLRHVSPGGGKPISTSSLTPVISTKVYTRYKQVLLSSINYCMIYSY